jgi:hypothetical protein
VSRFSEVRKRLKNIHCAVKSRGGRLEVEATATDRERQIRAGEIRLRACSLDEVIRWERSQRSKEVTNE